MQVRIRRELSCVMAQYLQQANAACGHHKVDVGLEMARAVQTRSGFGFGSRHAGWNDRIVLHLSFGRCDQLRCVLPSRSKHTEIYMYHPALQTRLGTVACDTDVIIAVSYQNTSAAVPSHPFNTAQALKLPDPFEARCK